MNRAMTRAAARAKLSATDLAVRDAMVEFMRMEDRICFASQATLAKKLGVSTKTVYRSQQRLEAAGEIVRVGKPRCSTQISAKLRVRTCVWKIPFGKRRLRHERAVSNNGFTRRTQTPRPCSARSRSFGSTPRYAGSRTSCATRDVRRRLRMDALRLFDDPQTPAEPPSEEGRLPVEASQAAPTGAGGGEAAVASRAPTAQDILAVLIDDWRQAGVAVHIRTRGIIARQAKDGLESGYAPELVLAACRMAIARSAPHEAWRIMDDMALVLAREHVSRKEYEQKVAAAKRRLDPHEQRGRELIERALGGRRHAGARPDDDPADAGLDHPLSSGGRDLP